MFGFIFVPLSLSALLFPLVSTVRLPFQPLVLVRVLEEPKLFLLQPSSYFLNKAAPFLEHRNLEWARNVKPPPPPLLSVRHNVENEATSL